jgi:hypothetical protein
MTPPYENVYIGNFIFALGFQAAKTRNGLSDKAVQLVQQTPDEHLLNDLFINWSGKNFIFEFKRNLEKISAELEKEAKKLLNTALNNQEHQAASRLSEKGHFLGFGLESGLGFVPYKSIHLKIERYYPMHKFCSALVAAENGLGLSHRELEQYLAFIKSVTNSTTDGCGPGRVKYYSI